MSKRHYVSMLWTTIAATLLAVGCGSGGVNDGSQEVDETNAENVNASSVDAGPPSGVWRVFGGEFCGDICGTLDCLCLPNTCPPKPAGKPCFPRGLECNEKFRNASSVTTYICE
jgi:hypothetical protein